MSHKPIGQKAYGMGIDLRVLAVLISSIPSLAAAAVRYNITSLGENFIPRDINEAGYVPTDPTVNGVSDGGGTVGYAMRTTGSLNHRVAKMFPNTAISNPFGGVVSDAAEVNDSGVVVGYGETSGRLRRAYRWTSSGGTVGLGLAGYDESEATGINNNGDIVGLLRRTSNGARASFVYRSGVMTALSAEYLYDINEAGDMVGSRDGVAYLRTSAGPMSLGTLGGTESYAMGINNLGQVVGSSFITLDAGSAAFLYEEGAGLQRLTNMIPTGTGWQLSQAYEINDAGEIIGYGRLNGVLTGFKLTPIPEPGTLAVFVGVSLLLLRRDGRSSEF